MISFKNKSKINRDGSCMSGEGNQDPLPATLMDTMG